MQNDLERIADIYPLLVDRKVQRSSLVLNSKHGD